MFILIIVWFKFIFAFKASLSVVRFLPGDWNKWHSCFFPLLPPAQEERESGGDKVYEVYESHAVSQHSKAPDPV